MATRVYIRNPQWCIKECIEVGVYDIAWDRGYLFKHRVDPTAFANIYFAPGTAYRMLCIGDQGTADVRPGSTLQSPAAVYPTWEYNTDDADRLEALCASPVGEDSNLCSDLDIPDDERPVLGQEHIVVITRLPDTRSGPGRQMIRLLLSLQEDYPDVVLHIHGLWGYSGMFSHGWKSVDTEPRTLAQKGRVSLPMGREVVYEDTRGEMAKWVHIVGFSPADLEVPRNRCMFNIKSALWAADNFNSIARPKTRMPKGYVPDIVSPDATAAPLPESARHRSSHHSIVVKPDDKVVCNSCSLANTCRYYREDSVCTVPDSEPAKLARMFGTRDSGQIIDGLAAFMEIGVNRLHMGLSNEELDGELNSDVTKLASDLFASGVKLAKLVDPKLAAAGAPKFGVNVNVGPNSQVAVATPQATMATIVAGFEERGVARKAITPKMIELAAAGVPLHDIIETTARER